MKVLTNVAMVLLSLLLLLALILRIGFSGLGIALQYLNRRLPPMAAATPGVFFNEKIHYP